MFFGPNDSGKEFEVIDEDGEVIGAFDHIKDASDCAKAAPWYHGEIKIRQDRSHGARRLAYSRKVTAEIRRSMEFGG